MGGGGFRQMLPGLAMGLIAGYGAPAMGLATGSTEGIMGGLFSGFSGTAAIIGGGLGSAMFATPPDVPDFGNQFQFQSDLLDRQNSFGRRSQFELEDLLENGSENDKNLAFDELRRRGEDENVLREIEGRSSRSEADQAAIDQFNLENPSPSSEDTRALAALFEQAGLRGLEEESEDAITQIKQKAFARGTGDSSRHDQLQLEQARLDALSELENKQAGITAATTLQDHEEKLRSAQFGRLVKSGEFAFTGGKAQVDFALSERKYQEALRSAKTAGERALAFQRFEADIDRQLAVYNQESQTSRQQGQLGLGIAEAGVFRKPFSEDDDEFGDVRYGESGMFDGRSEASLLP